MKIRGRGTTVFITSLLALFFSSSLNALSAFAEEGGPSIHEERHSLEGLPIALVILALVVAVGLAYGIGRRSRK